MFRYIMSNIDGTIDFSVEDLGNVCIDEYTNKVSKGKYEGVSIDTPLILDGVTSVHMITASEDKSFVKGLLEEKVMKYIDSRMLFYASALEHWEKALEKDSR